MKSVTCLVLLTVVTVALAAPKNSEVKNDDGEKRTSRQFWSPYPHGGAFPFYEPHPYVFRPLADQGNLNFNNQQAKPLKENLDQSSSYFKKVTDLANLKPTVGGQQKAEWTADGRLCIRPLLNLFGLLTTTTPKPPTCPPNPICPQAPNFISLNTGNPAGFLSALGGNIVGTIATSGTITGSATPGPGALVVVTAAPGFSKIQLTCTNPDVSFVYSSTFVPLTANTPYTSESNFLFFVMSDPGATDSCSWIQIV